MTWPVLTLVLKLSDNGRPVAAARNFTLLL
jgi:hypothetical protein